MSTKRVGRYELGQTLGEGTFAKVKMAVDMDTAVRYAVKVFNREQVAAANLQAQIKREIAVMKHVRHPHVVNVHEVLASRTHVYIVLELVTGGELFDRIATSGRLEERLARVYFQQLADGVAYCHERGVCHRDLKPENLLLDAAGRLKISDFGLSSLPEHYGKARAGCGAALAWAPLTPGPPDDGGAADDVRHAQLRGAGGAPRPGVRRAQRGRLVLRLHPVCAGCGGHALRRAAPGGPLPGHRRRQVQGAGRPGEGGGRSGPADP